MTTLRGYATPIAVVAALILVWLQLPDDWPISRPEGTLNTALTVAFWVLSIVVVVLLFMDRRDPEADEVEVEGPAFARYLFANRRAGLFWLPIFSWLTSGIGKALAPEGGWLDGGTALAGYWERAVAIPDAPARPLISYDWYREFLIILLDGGHESWFAWLVVPVSRSSRHGSAASSCTAFAWPSTTTPISTPPAHSARAASPT